jgi:putative PIG3 family NAD(P)H quinone oxidoreductase
MYAITLPRYGDPDVLTWAELPDPKPGPGEVLIDVAAAGVNRADILQRLGHYPPPPGAPEHPGMECSGTIAEVGEGVEGWQAGDEVCALVAGGAYASRVVAPAGNLLPVPDGVSLVEAAGLPEATCTVYANLFNAAHLQPDESVLIHGGASGIGTMAIQVAARHGARVFCTTSIERKRDRCAELGAEVVIDYRAEDFATRVGEETGGRGVDVILDIIGARYLTRNVEALATDGRLVVIGLQGGNKAELDLGALLAKRASVLATTLRNLPGDEKALIVAGTRAVIWPWLDDGSVRPVIDRVMPLANAAEAHRSIEQSEHIGKVLLQVT